MQVTRRTDTGRVPDGWSDRLRRCSGHRHLIEATLTQGLAPDQTLRCEPKASGRAVALNRLGSIRRA